ncbi:MAG: hypothetical protein M3R09_09445, partial [Actinomycetota bacterium]|nr:hypothetical protein [Actinomycetota bacterium]
MTDPSRPDDGTPRTPTPEEISERLEALLERTHALRLQQAATSGAAPSAWPPSEGELDDDNVVGVPPLTVGGGTIGAPAPARPDTRGDDEPVAGASDAGQFGRPDWAELRLRGAVEERSGAPTWLWLLTAVLAVAAIGQALYLWQLGGAGAWRDGSLRVDGPDGAIVRVDGREIGPAPLEYT